MADGDGGFAAVRPKLRSRLTAVFGHRVGNDRCPFAAPLYRYPSEVEFADALVFLKRHFRFVTLDAVIAHFRDGRPLPEYPLFLSFDDGFRNACERIVPILAEAGVPATFFLTAETIDNRDLFHGLRRSYLIGFLEKHPEPDAVRRRDALRATSVHTPAGRVLVDDAARALAVDWREVLEAERPFLTRAEGQAMLDMGFSLGAHGVTHRRLGALDEAARTEEVAASVGFMRDVFGLDRVAFAFPHGHRGVSEDWMENRLVADKRLSLFFGTGGFAPSGRALVHRVALDRPVDADGPFDIGATIAAAFGRVARG
jgi:peptidoglycan/xylan/chitin deacetylase (PgdA/CDA1 family)